MVEDLELPAHRKYDLLYALAIGFVVAAVLLVFHSRIGVRDVDSYSYVTGAYSLQAGHGYRNSNDEAISLWPPGYSLLLSAFTIPLAASLLVNTSSLGLAIALIFWLARTNEWTIWSATGLCLVLGFGFFRYIVTNAAPDMLTYAFFLLAALLYTEAGRRGRVLGYIIWSILIPFKFIALVFIPAAVLLLWVKHLRERRTLPLWETGLALLLWLLATGGLIVFDLQTTGSITTHAGQTIMSLIKNVVLFLETIPRSLIAYWYGSLKNPVAISLFALEFVLGVGCIALLRPNAKGTALRGLAFMTLIVTFLLLLVRYFDAGTRLTAYGLILLVLSYKPNKWGSKLWPVYGAIVALVGVVNLLTVNSFGANDPRYQALTHKLVTYMPSEGRVYTNSYHLLDIHERFPTWQTADPNALPAGSYYLIITLPSYDGIATIVPPPPPLDTGWCEVATEEGARLLRRCT